MIWRGWVDSAVINIPVCIATVDKLLLLLGTDEGDDLEMYGNETTVSTHQTSYSFEVSYVIE